MIAINNISKNYGGNIVLDIPELKINKGETFGLVGNNGAGKTTLFSLMLDLIAPSSGEILLSDNVVNQNEEWKHYTSAFIDESFLIDFLTPDEYFEFIGNLYNWNQSDLKELLAPYEEFFNGEILGVNKYIRDLSKGNQKKVGLIASFIGHPQILIWDEPFSNLDPTSQSRLKKIIEDKSKELTWLISSHDLNHMTEVCSRIMILEKGKMVKDLENDVHAKEELKGYFQI